jgi:bud site selection protein 20
MGTAPSGRKAGSRSKKKWFKKNVMCVKRRERDIDQIQDELAAIAGGRISAAVFHDDDAPGGGEHYCVPCARHFISAAVLAQHEGTKPHKKRLKEVAEEKWDQAAADAAAGKSRE